MNPNQIKIPITIKVNGHTLGKFQEWTEKVNEDIDDDNKENGHKHKNLTLEEVMSDMFDDIFQYGVDCTVYWACGTNPTERGYCNVDY